jgi:pSer/pThr/pTyr-binding forkhead associated (FHA) protein
MSDNSEKTIRTNTAGLKTPDMDKRGFSTTLEIARKTFIGKISTEQHAFLVIKGEKEEQIELGEEEFLIGRIPGCDIQLMVENVSRKHARILFRNEEYQIEDLGSTNGIYVNSVKVEKCILRNNDLIEIGGVEMLFSEEKIKKEP